MRGQALAPSAKAIVAHVWAAQEAADQVNYVKHGKMRKRRRGYYLKETAHLCGVDEKIVLAIPQEGYEDDRRRFSKRPKRKPRSFESRVAAEKVNEADILPVIKECVAAERELHHHVTCVQATQHLLALRRLRMKRGKDMGHEFSRLHNLVYRFLKRRGWMSGLEKADGGQFVMLLDIPECC